MTSNAESKMVVGIHQVPKSVWKFILLSFQHVFAMFGANILVPLVVNSMFSQAHGEGTLIPIQLAFLGSGVGTIIYLICTGFRVPIYLGSSFAFMTTMGTYYAASGYSTFVSLMLVGAVYVIVAFTIKMTKSGQKIKKILPPIIIGPAIMMIGLGAIFNGAVNDFGLGLFAPNQIIVENLETHKFEIVQQQITTDMLQFKQAWLYIGIATFTFLTIVICMLCFKNFMKVIPILIGLLIGSAFAIIVWLGLYYGGNKELARTLFDIEEGGNAHTLAHPNEWVWYPDITNLWKNPTIKESFNKDFQISPLLGLLPLSIITIAEHVGDHINIGQLTGNDFIGNKPGLHRTLLGDGLATMVSVAFGGVPNTSYGENTSVISVSKVASVWVIFTAAIIAIIISFLAPISALISAIPKPVLGGIEVILFSMIIVNGLRLLVENRVDLFKMKNIIIIAIIFIFSVAGIKGVGLTFFNNGNINVSMTGTGLGVLIAMILNMALPDEKNQDLSTMLAIDFTPADFVSFFKKKDKTNGLETKRNEQVNVQEQVTNEPIVEEVKPESETTKQTKSTKTNSKQTNKTTNKETKKTTTNKKK